jgi:hypothetical protein
MRVKTFLSVGVFLLISSVLAIAALDLRFTTAITQSPDPASAGNTVTFTVTFKTFGAAVTNLKIIGGVDAAQIFTRTYATIAANKQKTDTFNWTATAGSHTAWFVLDPAKSTGDSDYSNNRVEKALTVGGGLAPHVSTGPAIKPVKMLDKSLFNYYITVTDPHTGINWPMTTQRSIKWDTNINIIGMSFFIDLYSTDKQTKIKAISQGVTINSYLWYVPIVAVGDYRIRVSSFCGRDAEFVVGFSEIFHLYSPIQ